MAGPARRLPLWQAGIRAARAGAGGGRAIEGGWGVNEPPRAIILGRSGMVGRGRLSAAFVSLDHPASAADLPPEIEVIPLRPFHRAAI